MATRPVFFPLFNCAVLEERISFPWVSGFALSQKHKNIRALHEAVLKFHPGSQILEVSSRSPNPIGVQLSAFNLKGPLGGQSGQYACVESVFQASKVFKEGIGPFPEAYTHDPHEVRKRIRSCGGTSLVAFQYGKERWPLTPRRAFYDWVYCKMLHANPKLVEQIQGYNCFTDIEINPQRSLNCQGYALALYLSMDQAGVLEKALASKDAFLEAHPKDPKGVGTLVEKKSRKATQREMLLSWEEFQPELPPAPAYPISPVEPLADLFENEKVKKSIAPPKGKRAAKSSSAKSQKRTSAFKKRTQKKPFQKTKE